MCPRREASHAPAHELLLTPGGSLEYCSLVVLFFLLLLLFLFFVFVFPADLMNILICVIRISTAQPYQPYSISKAFAN